MNENNDERKKLIMDPISINMVNEYKYSILYVTFPNMEISRKIANNLLKKRMATFINLIPSIITMYTCNKNTDKNEVDSEILMLAKIRTHLSGQILQYLDDLHPYDWPEMYTVPIYDINPKLESYLDANLAKQI